MNERELVDLFDKHMKGNGYKCKKIEHPTSQKGWDIIIEKGDKKIGVEAKYFKGPKVSSLGSFMISMLSTRNSDEINDIFWLFNVDREGHTDNYFEYEYLIYLTEQIADDQKGRYWVPFLKDVEWIYLYDGRNRCFYRIRPDDYKELSKKWLEIVNMHEFEPYLKQSKKLNEKISLFKEKIVPELMKEML